MQHDRALDSATEIGMLVSDDASPITNAIEDILDERVYDSQLCRGVK